MSEPTELAFSDAAIREYRETVARYPTVQAALLPTLWIAQREFGWLSEPAQACVAKLMELPLAHVRAVVSFYTMFHRRPVGRFILDVCTNLPCRLRGADRIVACLSQRLKVAVGETTADRKFTLGSVECLASCGTAPMLQLNQERFVENLTVESVLKLVDELDSRDS